jgi:hypothetical protein
VVQQVRFSILAGTAKFAWSMSFFENLILFTSHFSILRRLPYKIPYDTNLVALFVGTFTTNFKKSRRTDER